MHEPLPNQHATRVLISLASLVTGHTGGAEHYARKLLAELTDSPGIEVQVIASRCLGAELGAMAVPVKTMGGAGNASRLGTLAMTLFSRKGRKIEEYADVIHFPVTVPTPLPPHGKPFIITMHDVQHLDHPEMFSRLERAYRRLAYDLPARRASAVITISEFSKARMVERLGLDPAKVHVAHLGHDVPTCRPSDKAKDEFVLYPARRWPHKNHLRLMEAMESLRETRRDLRLILTGDERKYPDAPSWVEDRGMVPRAELLDLYRRASCTAFPSLYEGFGLPPLEAMASGCPVAVSSRAALPEICGDAAVYFDPMSSTDIARGIGEAIDRSSELIARGQSRASQFTWLRCAERHTTVYRAIASQVQLGDMA